MTIFNAHQSNITPDGNGRSVTTTETFRVSGMTCSHCVRAVTTGISEIRGVRAVSVDLGAGLATVTSDAPLLRQDVAHAVEEAGYSLAA